MSDTLTLDLLRAELAEVDADMNDESLDIVSREDARERRKDVLLALSGLECRRYLDLTGRMPRQSVSKCRSCKGHGRIRCTCMECDNDHERRCENCGGRGETIEEVAA